MELLNAVDAATREILLSLDSPVKIQRYLDSLPYNGEDANRCPLGVTQVGHCHCLDGGMLAAAALERIGFEPLLIDLVPVPGIDDDHVLAVFQVNGLWGCVAKSNFTNLRFRDPVYRSPRELVMSYFEVFFNIDGIKTLRGYTRPLSLRAFDRYHWQVKQSGSDRIVKKLYTLKPVPVVPPASIPLIERLDQRSLEVGFIGVNMDGLYKPH